MVCFTMIVWAKCSNIIDCVCAPLTQRDNMVRFQENIPLLSGKTGFPAQLANPLSALQNNITNHSAPNKLGTYAFMFQNLQVGTNRELINVKRFGLCFNSLGFRLWRVNQFNCRVVFTAIRCFWL